MLDSGVEKIIAEIEKKANDRVNTILTKAREEAEMILNEARGRAGKEEEAIINKGKQEINQRCQRILADARIKVKRGELYAKEGAIQAAFDRARDSLKAIVDGGMGVGSRYRNVLVQLIAGAAMAMDGEEFEVILSGRDKEVFENGILEETRELIFKDTNRGVTFRVSDDTSPSTGGVIVSSVGKGVEVNNTFDARLERFREELRTGVAGILFE